MLFKIFINALTFNLIKNLLLYKHIGKCYGVYRPSREWPIRVRKKQLLWNHPFYVLENVEVLKHLMESTKAINYLVYLKKSAQRRGAE